MDDMLDVLSKTQERVVDLGQQLLEMQRVARESERDLGAPVAREVLLRVALDTFPFQEYGRAQREGCDANGAWDSFVEEAEKHIQAALATPSPAAEALLELARAAEAALTWFEQETDGPVRVEELTSTYGVLYLATRKWQRARG